MKLQNAKFLFLFAASLFLFDAAFARYLLWIFPNETAWGAEPHYNFEYRIRKLKRERDPEEFMVLVVGSSIAEYAVHETQLEKLLNAKNLRRFIPETKKKVRVFTLAHQGQNSMNLLSTADRILELDPDLVIHPVNMIDFRLERPLVLGNLAALENTGETRERALYDFARAVVYSDEIRMLGPYGTLRYFYKYLTSEEIAECLMSLVSATYRYRDIAGVPLDRFYKNRFGNRHSYHFYSGMNIGGGGVNQNGHAGTELEILWNEFLAKDGFEIQIYPQMFLEKNALLQYSIGCSGTHAEQIALKPGWQKLFFNPVKPGERLCMKILPGYYTDFFSDTLGGRLADNTGTGPSEHSWERDLRREDMLYRSYTDEEYEKSFKDRIMKFDRSGMAYLQYIMLSKQEMAKRRFDGEYPVFQAYSKWRDIVSSRVPLLIINSPENPINLAWYGNSDWYRGYLDFLSCRENSNCSMHDASAKYPRQYFYDYHHMSWFGAEEFTEFTADLIMDFYKAQSGQSKEARH